VRKNSPLDARCLRATRRAERAILCSSHTRSCRWRRAHTHLHSPVTPSRSWDTSLSAIPGEHRLSGTSGRGGSVSYTIPLNDIRHRATISHQGACRAAGSLYLHTNASAGSLPGRLAHQVGPCPRHAACVAATGWASRSAKSASLAEMKKPTPEEGTRPARETGRKRPTLVQELASVPLYANCGRMDGEAPDAQAGTGTAPLCSRRLRRAQPAETKPSASAASGHAPVLRSGRDLLGSECLSQLRSTSRSR
jgi:hypothetical protein